MPKRLLRIHLLAKKEANDQKLIELPDGRYESGNWRIAENVAESARGSEIHLHEHQGAPSWIAGRINTWFRHPVERGRILFVFERDDRLRREEPDGWGTGAEKKYVYKG